MIRLFDVIISSTGIVFLFPVFVVLYGLCFLDTGSPLFTQERVGKNKRPFHLAKFRTMKVGTESIASHLVVSSDITKLGKLLRKTKLDELPQLYNVLVGDMSLVGPRPSLYNQEDLIRERDALGIYRVSPGITGLAQIRSIDMSTPRLLASVDKEMLENLTLMTYFRIILNTICGKGNGDAAP